MYLLSSGLPSTKRLFNVISLTETLEQSGVVHPVAQCDCLEYWFSPNSVSPVPIQSEILASRFHLENITIWSDLFDRERN